MPADHPSSRAGAFARLRRVLAETVLGQLFVRISLVLLPALAVLGALQWRSADAVAASLAQERTAARVQALAALAMRQLAVQEDATKSMLLEPDRVSEESARKISAFDARLAAVDTILQLLPTPELRAQAMRLAALDTVRMAPLETRILEEVLGGDRLRALALYRNEYVPASAEYAAQMSAIEQEADREMARAQLAAAGASRSANRRLAIGVAVLLTVLLVAYMSASRALAAKLGRFSAALDALGGGSLKPDVDTTGTDEIARLHATLGTVAAGMRDALHVDRVDWSAVGRDREERHRQEALAREAAAREAAQFEETRRKVDELLRVVEAASQGDLTATSPVQGDDALGRMGAGLEALVSELRRSLGRIRGESMDLTTAAADLRSTADRLAQHSSVLSGEVGTVNGSAAQASEAVSSAAAATEQLNASVREIARSAERAATLARETAGVTRSTLDAMRALDHSAAQITDMVGSINAIAEQTNLLALNATIEAARAGEAGRGFAIVANEVKELARSTRQVTADIGQRLEGMTSDAGRVGEAIRRIADAVAEIAEVQTAVAAAAEEQSVVTGDMAQTLAAAAGNGDAVAHAVARLQHVAEEGAGTANDMRESAAGLAEIATSLAGLVQRFRIDAGAHPERRAMTRR
jgi:methyl-accepting chemotaxis protein